MHSRESLIAALCKAAEIEHSITCQYLFAAFSLKSHPEEGGVDWPRLERIRGWKAELLSVARQEMMHHGLVCNLLLAIGGPPHFRRAEFPHPVDFCAPYSTLELLPFSEEALERFVSYERRSAPGVETLASGRARTIDALYQEIRDGLVHVNRASVTLFVGPVHHQITNQELRIGPGQFDVDLVKVSELDSALALIDRIREHTHQEQLESIQRELAELKREDPIFAPARPVAANPRVGVPEGAHEAVTIIRHPVTRAAAELFNASYEVMVLMLTRLYGRSQETPAEADGLIRSAFFPLMTNVIRPLGEALTLMPLAEDESSMTAGPGFEFPFGLPLPPTSRSAWIFIHERLMGMTNSSLRLFTAIQQSPAPWAARLRPRLELLCENLERISDNFKQHMALEREYAQLMVRRFR
jgi:hypothetical protein